MQAAEFSCKAHEPGCDKSFFRHFKALEAAFTKAEKQNAVLFSELGKAVEQAYQSVWLQRYQNGVQVHLSQRVPFSKTMLPSHEGSTFIIKFHSAENSEAKDKGAFFFHWSPRVTGIYDVDLFKAILAGYPRDPSLLNWPEGKKIPDSELTEIFRPHTESSPKNLSGGLAVTYAMYRLDAHLGLPLEQQSTRMILRKNFQQGYILVGMPSPDYRKGAVEDAGFVYVFKTDREPKGDSNSDRYADGKKFKAGSWQALAFDAGKLEKKFRPKRGLFRE